MATLNWTSTSVQPFIFSNSSSGDITATSGRITTTIAMPDATYSTVGAFVLAVIALLLNLLVYIGIRNITLSGRPGSPSRGVKTSARHILFTNQALADTLACLSLLAEQAADRWFVPWIVDGDHADLGSGGRLLCSIIGQRSLSSAFLIAGSYNAALSFVVGVVNGGSRVDNLNNNIFDKPADTVNIATSGEGNRNREVDKQITDNGNGIRNTCQSCKADHPACNLGTDGSVRNVKDIHRSEQHATYGEGSDGQTAIVEGNGSNPVKEGIQTIGLQHRCEGSSSGNRDDRNCGGVKLAETKIGVNCNYNITSPLPYSYMFTSSGCRVSAIGVWVLGVLVSFCFALPVHSSITVTNLQLGDGCGLARIINIYKSINGSVTLLSTRELVRLWVEDLIPAIVMIACLIEVVFNWVVESWKDRKLPMPIKCRNSENEIKESTLSNGYDTYCVTNVNGTSSNGDKHISIPLESRSNPAPNPTSNNFYSRSTDDNNSNNHQNDVQQITSSPNIPDAPIIHKPNYYPDFSQYTSTTNVPVECGIQRVYLAVVASCICFLITRLSYACMLIAFNYSYEQLPKPLWQWSGAWLFTDESLLRSFTCLFNPLMMLMFCQDLRRNLPLIAKLLAR